MNLLQIAKHTIENKQQWTIGEVVVIFKNNQNQVSVKLTQHGRLIMFVCGKAHNINYDFGFLSHPQYSELAYNRWVKSVKAAM